MNKQQFIKHLKELIRIKKEAERVDKVIRESPLNDNLSTMAFGSGYYEELLLNILKDAMDDKDDWIGYFIYDRNMKFTKKNIINDKNGNNLPLRNFDDLYNLIVKE